MVRLLLIAVAFIVYGSLYPFHFDFGRSNAGPLTTLLHAWPERIDRFAWRDACVNVLLYFPLGLAASLAFMRRWPRVVAMLGAVMLGAGLSASIEMLQIFDAHRTCSLLDLVCNSAGTLGGAGAALILRRQILEIAQRHKGNRAAGGAVMLACCWAGYQLYPLIPLFSRGHLRASVTRFLTTPISAVEVGACAAEWFAFALLARAVAGRMRASWLLLAMLCLPLRLLIMERSLGPDEVLGAALAMLVWTYPAEGSRVRAGAAMLGAAVVLRELAPFAFSGPGRPMSWVPFLATFEAERLSGALVLLRKTFEYGALVWLLRGSGLRYWSAGLWVGAALMVLETAQRYLPNRQPEVTDAAIAGIVASVLWGSERRARA
jgi:VanZ family protein